MLTQTTAQGIQQEKYSQLKKTHGASRVSGQPLNINWNKVSAAVATAAVALAVMAGSTGQAAAPEADRVPAVTEESDNAPTWDPTSSSDAPLGGAFLGPLTAN